MLAQSFAQLNQEYPVYQFSQKKIAVLGNVQGIMLPVYPLLGDKKAAGKKDFGDASAMWNLLSVLQSHKLIPEDIAASELKNVYQKVHFANYPLMKYLHFDKSAVVLDEKRYRDALVRGTVSGSSADLHIDISSLLLRCDEKRATLTPYPARMLTDINAGHWELYEQQHWEPGSDMVKMPIREKLTARPPVMDIHSSGICAIDFGTSSTTVVCRDGKERLLRIGKGDYTKAPTAGDYENPTAIELRDIMGFQKAYAARSGRPYTEWEQMTVSHQALNRLLEDKEAGSYQQVFSEMKQWANCCNGQRRLRDRQGVEIVLSDYAGLGEDDFDPIEYYAYYLGLYINNMLNGIYLEYILSYPVKYSKEIRERLRLSFERGLRKSLPSSLLDDDELMRNFRVYLGASEPAAYASCALKELGRSHKELQPTAGKPVCYAVFDFGGGTTDFDYGLWRLPNETDKGRYNYVIEHFGAEGDVHLGGEKLLGILAYEVYKTNLEIMREKQIPFFLPVGCTAFAGSELLLNSSDEAHMNLRRLSSELRPVWEAPESEAARQISSQPLEVTLFAGGKLEAVSLRVDLEKLQAVMKERIQQGIDSFFLRMYHSFREQMADVVHILLAGNSCKSVLVQQLFAAKIAEEEANVQQTVRKVQHRDKKTGEVFKLYLPLGLEASADVDYECRPTGKTGVAFGLLDCRKGGHDVKVINRDLSPERQAPFAYYLGTNGRYDNFEVLIGKEVGYDIWVPFFEIEDDCFELYYTAEARALDNKLAVSELPAPKKCWIHYQEGGGGGIVHIRKIAPQTIEYTVMTAEGTTVAPVEKCELG